MTGLKRELGSDTVTEGIRIRVEPRYDAARSEPEGRGVGGDTPSGPTFVFAYRVVISNEGLETARLVSRRWTIRDADGEESEVVGPGVVGYTPTLEEGESFEYESWCPLPTAWGTMEGVYEMERLDDEGNVTGHFDAVIGRFYLVSETSEDGE